MRRRHNHRRKNKNVKNVVIGCFVTTFLLATGYSAFQTNLNINAKGTIVEKNRVIKSWTSSSNEDFHTDFYRENIVSATFLDSSAVPNNAVKSWDVSADKKKGVMAYVTESSSETDKYDLFIGANKGVTANEDSSYLFYNFSNLKSIEFGENFDTSRATTMDSMFAFCTNISSLDLSNFDTSNVTNMKNIFQMYNNPTNMVVENKLTKIIFGNKWSTKNVTNMAQMFVGLENLTSIDVSNFDTSSVVNMQSVFAYCRKLTFINVSHWNTSSVNDMSWLFTSCDNLTSLDLSNFDTSNVIRMKQMFSHCISLTELNLCSFNTSKVATMYEMFWDTIKLKKINVGPNWTTTNADTTSMFLKSGVSSVTTGEC